MPTPTVALGLPGALAAVLIAVVAFAVVLGVCFVVLRLLSFVLGADQEEPHSRSGEASPDAGDDSGTAAEG